MTWPFLLDKKPFWSESSHVVSVWQYTIDHTVRDSLNDKVWKSTDVTQPALTSHNLMNRWNMYSYSTTVAYDVDLVRK